MCATDRRCSRDVRFAQQPVFRQLFDATSGTYTCLIASRHGGEALIIDPVLERVDRYLQLVASSTSSWSSRGNPAVERP